VRSEVAWDLIEAFLAAEFSRAERHLRRLNKVILLEQDLKNNSKSKGNDYSGTR